MDVLSSSRGLPDNLCAARDHSLAVPEAEALQRKYSARRKRWARHIGIPVNGDLDNPDPGELDLADDQEG